ncbi:phage tail assembly chaperone [Vibrio diabolicus]|uniref:phage tail assembly chaperone n=1 Tax=Vibrio diabolicus TaxID=50719 RepID=UPI0037532A3C
MIVETLLDLERKPIQAIPENDGYIKERHLNGQLLSRVTVQAPTPPTPEQTEINVQAEKAWRDGELDYVDSKNYGESFPYFTQVEDYKQALRDYPMQPDFPYGERPVRPVNENGNPIIT